MKDLHKVNSSQILEIWKNVSVGLLTIIAVIVGSKLLPFYFSPVVGLVGAAFLFSMLYRNKVKRGANCMLVSYSLFFCLIAYSFVSIFVNVLYIWGWVPIPEEFIFFNDPYIPTLWMNPIAFFTLLIINLRRNRLQLCIDCRLLNGTHANRGTYGSIINTESKLQLRNLMWVAGILTVIVWSYYLIAYKDINTNAKDRYIFFWITIIFLGLDILYFLYRYYNLYLDLKENNELITPEELEHIEGKTYLRYYLICGNYVYLYPNDGDATNPFHSGIDTPFFEQVDSSDVTKPEALDIIRKETGIPDGELRFYYGRRTPDIDKHKVLRFFYFVDGKPQDYKNLPPTGEWIDFEEIKKIYSLRPDLLSNMTVSDLSRLATIMVTHKTYKENGQRRHKLKRYQPSFDLYDVRDTDIDFHGDKWLRVAIYNSDNRFYRLRRLWRKLVPAKQPVSSGQ